MLEAFDRHTCGSCKGWQQRLQVELGLSWVTVQLNCTYVQPCTWPATHPPTHTPPTHLPSPQEMARACKPGGKIVLLEHGRSSWGFVNRILDNGAQAHKNKWGCFWNRDILELVRQVGRWSFKGWLGAGLVAPGQLGNTQRQARLAGRGPLHMSRDKQLQQRGRSQFAILFRGVGQVGMLPTPRFWWQWVASAAWPGSTAIGTWFAACHSAAGGAESGLCEPVALWDDVRDPGRAGARWRAGVATARVSEFRSGARWRGWWCSRRLRCRAAVTCSTGHVTSLGHSLSALPAPYLCSARSSTSCVNLLQKPPLSASPSTSSV